MTGIGSSRKVGPGRAEVSPGQAAGPGIKRRNEPLGTLRFDARSRVIWSPAISPEARLVYLALDDMARDRGSWYEKQFKLGVMLGFSERQLRRHFSELAEAGLVRCDRTGRSTLFTLTWSTCGKMAADRSNMTDQEAGRPVIYGRSDRSNMTARSSRFLNTSSTNTQVRIRSTVCRCGKYHDGEDRVRCVCGSVHDPGTAAEVDAYEATGRLLWGYVQGCGLDWPEPDVEIIAATLEAAGGSLAVLEDRLRTLRNDRRLAPRTSYAWFPTVIASAGSSRRSA
jgi:hypothetical protein